jgi:hypothetical protein
MINGEWFDYPEEVIDKLVEVICGHEVRIKELEEAVKG